MKLSHNGYDLGSAEVTRIGNLSYIMANTQLSHHSCSGCLSGDDSWGTSAYGSYDGVEWTPLDGEEDRSHVQNSRPTGWEKTGTTKTSGKPGVIGWRRYRFVAVKSSGPTREHNGRATKRNTLIIYKVPSANRRVSLARSERRSKAQAQAMKLTWEYGHDVNSWPADVRESVNVSLVYRLIARLYAARACHPYRTQV